MLKSEIVFEEKQCFAKRSVRNFFLLLVCFFIISIFIRLLLRKVDGDDGVIGILITGFIISFVLSIFLGNCLITQITIDGIYVRFPPFIPSQQQYLWKDIREVNVIRYKPITQYGGWGVRIGPYGRAFNISGTTGLQVIFHDNSTLLIGTGQPEKLVAVLRRLGKIN